MSKNILLYQKELKEIEKNFKNDIKFIAERVDTLNYYLYGKCFNKNINTIIKNWTYLKLNISKLSKNINKLEQLLNFIANKSKQYKSNEIKKIIIKKMRDKYYLADKLSISKYRFDILSVQKYGSNKKIIEYEIKTNKNDLINDKKFENYLDYCNILYFVVPVELVEIAKDKIENSKYKRNIGLYLYENLDIKLIKKTLSNKKEFNIQKYKNMIMERMYNKIIFSI